MEKEQQDENQNTKRRVGRIIAGAYYDMQDTRISSMNRVRDVIRKKLEGIDWNEVEDEKEKSKKQIKSYSDAQLVEKMEEINEKDLLSDKELKYLKNCLDLLNESQKLENKYKRRMKEFVESEPIYQKFLSKIRGIGPVLSANLIKEFGYCERYDNVGKLWHHTGNHVKNGKAPKKKKGEEITFSPRLRTFTWKISDCLMKSNRGYYRDVYDKEKEKQLNREYEPGELAEKYDSYDKEDTSISQGHAHNRALRKVRKLFLSQYWGACRELTNQDTRIPYVKEKLRHKNIVTWKDAIKKEGGA